MSSSASDAPVQARDDRSKPATLRNRVEYAAVRVVAGALSPLGVRRAGRLGGLIGTLGYWPFKIRRRVVERQVAAALPELSDANRETVAREAYANLGQTFVESAILGSRSKADILDLFETVVGWDVVEACYARGRGVVFATGHLGNWELAGSYVGARGVPVAAVARHMANPIFERYVTRVRERSGMRIIYDDEAASRIPRLLRAGGGVAFLFDQGALGLASTWVPFFGRLAKTAKGAGLFALRFGAPVIFAFTVRLPSGRFRMEFEEVVVEPSGDRDADVDRITAAITERLERRVREHPGQYFWHHRRWKHQQAGTPPELGDPLK